MKHKICVATGTRAEYGLLKPLIDEMLHNHQWDLQLLVTGAHLSPEFGLTYKLIEQDGLKIDAKVEMLLSSDTSVGIVKSMGLGMIGFADALERLRPDWIVILGDRYEMLSLASAALIFKIPIIHLHGGEITEGAYDDAIRHAITKMSYLHFTSTEDYRKRVIQLGEDPERVFNVGAIGLDNIRTLELMDKKALEDNLQIRFLKKNYLVTFHPATMENELPVQKQFEILLNAIAKQKDSYFIFTKANSDTDGRIINRIIDDYVSGNEATAAAFTTLGQLRYLSVMKIADAVVGNSSSGIIEAPSFQVPTINIGDRQKGRIQAKSILNTAVTESGILQAFEALNETTFRETVQHVVNPYGDGFTTERIMKILSAESQPDNIVKSFYNIAHD